MNDVQERITDMNENGLAEAADGLRDIAVRDDFYMGEDDVKLILVTSE